MIASPQTASEASAPSLARFWTPRYWPTWVLLGWLRLTAALPWRTAIGLHRLIGRGLWHLLPRRRAVVLRNLELCFPELDDRARQRLGRRSFENVTASVAEVAIAWFSPTLPPVRVEGREHLDAALAKGHGVVLYSGHFTTLELTGQFVRPLTPRFAFMFRTRSNALIDAVQARGRRRTADISFRNSDSRAMLRALRDNAVVWYAADQVYDGPGAELLPFFGEPAKTNTATSRIARISGASILPFRFERLEDGSGYRIEFAPALQDVPSGDPAADTRKLTAVLEGFIRDCPEQYLWTHRRFRGRGPGLPDAYAPREERHAPERQWGAVLARVGLIGAVAGFIAAVDNDPLWQTAWRATVNDEHRVAILWSMFAIVFCTLTGALALALGSRLLKTLAAALLLIAAACGFFMTEYGAIIDQSMIRNAVETTALEATPLLSPAFFWHVALYGALPAVAVMLAPLGRLRWRADLFTRAAVVAVSGATLVGSLYANFAAVSFFGHQHHTLRLLMNPGYPVYAAATFGLTDDSPPPIRTALDMRRASPTGLPRKPALVVFVMGETARADRFSFNGYERDTNRYTRPLDVINFPSVQACGTSTADSVPCIFSSLSQTRFTHAAAAHEESLFGALQRLGVSTFWRDNSTGCKDVCDEAHFEERASWSDPELCDDTGCFDEILLQDFADLLADPARDHFIVLHQRGSHGPAYHTDVPAWAKEFMPECNLANLRNCDREAVNNSYDNTILYTDYFLSRLIEKLKEHSGEFATAMLYVSDHGESLGENGLYLHGFPYAMAPREQKEVPMLFWASPDFYSERIKADSGCLRRTSQRDTTHDAIFHTLLPLFDVESPLYDQALDIFATCRGNAVSAQALSQAG